MILHRTKWDHSTLFFFAQQALILFIGVVNGSAKSAGTVISQTVSPNSLSPSCSNLTWRTKNTSFYICFDSIVPKHSVLRVIFIFKISRVICSIPPMKHFFKNWFIEELRLNSEISYAMETRHYLTKYNGNNLVIDCNSNNPS